MPYCLVFYMPEKLLNFALHNISLRPGLRYKYNLENKLCICLFIIFHAVK